MQFQYVPTFRSLHHHVQTDFELRYFDNDWIRCGGRRTWFLERKAAEAWSWPATVKDPRFWLSKKSESDCSNSSPIYPQLLRSQSWVPDRRHDVVCYLLSVCLAMPASFHSTSIEKESFTDCWRKVLSPSLISCRSPGGGSLAYFPPSHAFYKPRTRSSTWLALPGVRLISVNSLQPMIKQVSVKLGAKNRVFA
jgi:hypothetical protein